MAISYDSRTMRVLETEGYFEYRQPYRKAKKRKKATPSGKRHTHDFHDILMRKLMEPSVLWIYNQKNPAKYPLNATIENDDCCIYEPARQCAVCGKIKWGFCNSEDNCLFISNDDRLEKFADLEQVSG